MILAQTQVGREWSSSPQCIICTTLHEHGLSLYLIHWVFSVFYIFSHLELVYILLDLYQSIFILRGDCNLKGSVLCFEFHWFIIGIRENFSIF